MGYEFMPTGLDSLRYTAGAYAASGKSGGLTAEELRDILTYANRAAAITCSRSGAIPAMPRAEEL